MKILQILDDNNSLTTKLDAIKRLSPTREQFDQAIAELDAELVVHLPRGSNSPLEAQGLHALLESRLVLQCLLTNDSTADKHMKEEKKLLQVMTDHELVIIDAPCFIELEGEQVVHLPIVIEPNHAKSLGMALIILGDQALGNIPLDLGSEQPQARNKG